MSTFKRILLFLFLAGFAPEAAAAARWALSVLMALGGLLALQGSARSAIALLAEAALLWAALWLLRRAVRRRGGSTGRDAAGDAVARDPLASAGPGAAQSDEAAARRRNGGGP
jgi:cobalamin synthase